MELLPRRVDLRAVDAYYIVAAVGRGVVGRFVLAHEGDGYGAGHAAQGSGVGGCIEEVPGAGIG